MKRKDEQEEIVRATAALARLRVSGDEIRELASEFAEILSAFEKLRELEVSNTEAMVRANDSEGAPRDDVPTTSLLPDDLLANAPERSQDFFSVPKTLGGDA